MKDTLWKLKGNLIENQFSLPQNGHQLDKFSPADLEQPLWNTYEDLSIISHTVEASHRAFTQWRHTSFEERCHLLLKYADLVTEKKDEIAQAIAMETGKPLWESLTEAGALAAKVQITINESLKRIETKNYDQIMPNTKGIVSYKPIGACLVIGPFNFPCHLANGQIVSAILAGNTVIFKPSEKTLYSTQLMSECFVQAGFPPGVYQYLIGAGELAKNLVDQKLIKGVYFTGSKQVGIKLAQQSASRLDQLLALELGGKNTSILFEDTLIEESLEELLKACFLTSGQRCTSTGIIAVHQSKYQEFVDKFKNISEKIIVDHPIKFNETPFMGPLIDDQSQKTYQEYLKLLQQQGGKLILAPSEVNTKFKGYYCAPSISAVDQFKTQYEFLKEEIFAPHCSIVPFSDTEEAIAIANCSSYGLAAAVYTQDAQLAQYAVDRIDAGIININRSTVGASSRLPFGGVKYSGNYRPAAVSMIDHCVSACSSLFIERPVPSDGHVLGLKK